MEKIPVFFIALVITVMICGCIQTPAKVATEVPGVLKNVSTYIGNTTGQIGDNFSNATNISIKSTNDSIVLTYR